MGDVIANLSLFRIREDLHFEHSRRTSPLLDPWPVNHWQWYYARAIYGIIEHIISGIDCSARTNNLHAMLCMRPIRGAFTVSTEDHGASIRPLCMLATGARSSKDQGTDWRCSYGHIVFTTIGYTAEWWRLSPISIHSNLSANQISLDWLPEKRLTFRKLLFGDFSLIERFPEVLEPFKPRTSRTVYSNFDWIFDKPTHQMLPELLRTKLI